MDEGVERGEALACPTHGMLPTVLAITGEGASYNYAPNILESPCLHTINQQRHRMRTRS
jgi:hypothetical protein